MGDYNLALSRRFTIKHCASRYEQVFTEMVLAARTQQRPVESELVGMQQ
jgi:hypothetical protein